MRHLKLYENFETQFKEISQDEFSLMQKDTLFGIHEVITDKEFDLMKQSLSDLGYKYQNTTHSKYSDWSNAYLVDKDSDITEGRLGFILQNENIYIYKMPDEWYYVYMSWKYYKCDEVEGVIQLFKKLLQNPLNESYYNEIPKEDFFNTIGDDNYDDTEVTDEDYIVEKIEMWEDFNKEEITQIKNLFPNDYIIVGYHYVNNNLKESVSNGLLAITKNKYFKPSNQSNWQHTIAFIVKLPDEWFYTGIYKDNKYYKCDQFNGVLELLKNHK